MRKDALTSYGLDHIDRAIAGDRKALSRAFIWDDTQEGHEYWSRQATGIDPIDVKALTEMAAELRAKEADGKGPPPFGERAET